MTPIAYDPTTKNPKTEQEVEDEILSRNRDTKSGADLFASDRDAAVETLRELEAREGGRHAMFED